MPQSPPPRWRAPEPDWYPEPCPGNTPLWMRGHPTLAPTSGHVNSLLDYLPILPPNSAVPKTVEKRKRVQVWWEGGLLGAEGHT